ncbi:MAG: sodium ion-translocating decarboxylase subunit beta [Dehalococcoidia bacterium]
MDSLIETGFEVIGGDDILMVVIGIVLVYLGISKKWEPLLLVPIGFSIVLVNLPLGGLLESTGGDLLDKDSAPVGLIAYIFKAGIQTEIIPPLIFLGLGAMTDFEPLIANPKTLILGAAGQFGVYATLFLAVLIGSGWLGITDWGIKEACTIGIIGGADGPTTVYLSDKLAPHLLGTVAVAAYIYMAMVPIIQPPIIRLCTTKKERQIYMKPVAREVSQKEKFFFPFVGAIVIILLVPKSAPLIGSFMMGNLLYISGVTDRLAKTSREAFMDILTIFLGLSIGGIMTADNFLNLDSILAFVLGIFAFASATAFGIMIAKLMNKVCREPINPMIGAAGVSAVPMSARVVQMMGQKENPRNFLLMHAMGPNIAGVIGTATAAGIFLSMVG